MIKEFLPKCLTIYYLVNNKLKYRSCNVVFPQISAFQTLVITFPADCCVINSITELINYLY